MSELVIDCSIAVAWHFEDEWAADAEAVLRRLSRVTARVPGFFHLEILNALLYGERRHRTTPIKSDQFLRELRLLRIETEPSLSLVALQRIQALARAHQLSSYDAMYLELATRYGLPLATLDKRLRAAAQRAGVHLFDPAQ